MGKLLDIQMRIDQIKSALLAQFFFSFSTLFLMIMLPLLLIGPPFNFDAFWMATIIAAYSFTCHAFEPLTAQIINKVGYRNSLIFGGFLCALSLWMVIVFPMNFMCFILLQGFAFGKSLTSLSIRLKISEIEDESERVKTYCRNHRIVNIAGGLAPILGLGISYEIFVLHIFFFAGLCVLMGSVTTYFTCANNKIVIKRQGQEKFSFLDGLKEMKRVLAYYVLLFFVVYSCFQTNLLPLFYKTSSVMPAYLGFVLAINPLLIIIFQDRIGELYKAYLKDREDIGFFLSLIFFITSYFLFYSTQSFIGVFLFVLGVTFGEMLSFPIIDFMITKSTRKCNHAFLLSVSAIVFAIGRTISDGGGIYFLRKFFELKIEIVNWWLLNAVISCMIFMFFCFKMVSKIKKSKIHVFSQ